MDATDVLVISGLGVLGFMLIKDELSSAANAFSPSAIWCDLFPQTCLAPTDPNYSPNILPQEPPPAPGQPNYGIWNTMP